MVWLLYHSSIRDKKAGACNVVPALFFLDSSYLFRDYIDTPAEGFCDDLECVKAH